MLKYWLIGAGFLVVWIIFGVITNKTHRRKGYDDGFWIGFFFGFFGWIYVAAEPDLNVENEINKLKEQLKQCIKELESNKKPLKRIDSNEKVTMKDTVCPECGLKQPAYRKICFSCGTNLREKAQNKK